MVGEIIEDIENTNNNVKGMLVEPQVIISALCNCINDSDISVVKKSLDTII